MRSFEVQWDLYRTVTEAVTGEDGDVSCIDRKDYVGRFRTHADAVAAVRKGTCGFYEMRRVEVPS